MKSGDVFSIHKHVFSVKDVANSENKEEKCVFCSNDANMICLPCEHQNICSFCESLSPSNSCLTCKNAIKERVEVCRLKFLESSVVKKKANI